MHPAEVINGADHRSPAAADLPTEGARKADGLRKRMGCFSASTHPELENRHELSRHVGHARRGPEP